MLCGESLAVQCVAFVIDNCRVFMEIFVAIVIMKTIAIQSPLSARRSPVLVLLAVTSIASLSSTFRAEALTGAPKNQVIATVKVGENPDCIVVSPDSKTVYVANNNGTNGCNSSVSVIDAFDLPRYTVEATICISDYALYLALSPDGNTLYVSEYPPSLNTDPSANVVEVYDVTNPTNPSFRTRLKVGDDVGGLAASPDGTKLYVTNGSPVYARKISNDLAAPGSIYVFNTTTFKQTNNIICHGSPFQVLFVDKGAQAEQADVLNEAGAGFIQFIQVALGKLSNSTGAGGRIFEPSGMVTNASGSILCVADDVNYVAVCNAQDGTVSAIYPAVSSVFDLEFLGQPALTPNGEYLYVPYGGGGRLGIGYGVQFNPSTGLPVQESNDQVVMLNVSTGQIIGSLITVGYNPVWAQVSPDGTTLYVANNSDGTVSVIDITPN